MKMTRRILAWALAMAMLITCGITGISTSDSFRRVWPFILIFVFAAVILMAFPQISLFLPGLLGML